jgi:hypothetical protein
MTLPEALEPLYRGYLRRLDEMVARLPEGTALTERTSRTEDGRFALGPSGLPLRFDVADGRDGHTYEVHGARPDAPLADEVRIAGLPVRLQPGNWEELPVACIFEREPSPEEAEALAELFRGFTVLAWHGGFAGAKPADVAGRWTGRAHGVQVELRGSELRAVLDLGTCPPAAIDALCRAVAGYAAERGPLSHLRIGGGTVEPG